MPTATGLPSFLHEAPKRPFAVCLRRCERIAMFGHALYDGSVIDCSWRVEFSQRLRLQLQQRVQRCQCGTQQCRLAHSAPFSRARLGRWQQPKAVQAERDAAEGALRVTGNTLQMHCAILEPRTPHSAAVAAPRAASAPVQWWNCTARTNGGALELNADTDMIAVHRRGARACSSQQLRSGDHSPPDWACRH